MDSGVSPLEFHVVRPITAAAQVADQIRTAILERRLSPSSRLPSELQLAKQFGVSRSTVREGLRLLAASNLITTTRGRHGGAFVALPDTLAVAESVGHAMAVWFHTGSLSIAEADEAWLAIGRDCVRLASQSRNRADLDTLKSVLDAMEEQSMPTDTYTALYTEFHVGIARLAKNRVLYLAMTPLLLIRPVIMTRIHHLISRDVIARHHRALLHHIERSEPDAAVTAFEDHHAYMVQIERESFTRLDPSDIAVSMLSDKLSIEYLVSRLNDHE